MEMPGNNRPKRSTESASDLGQIMRRVRPGWEKGRSVSASGHLVLVPSLVAHHTLTVQVFEYVIDVQVLGPHAHSSSASGPNEEAVDFRRPNLAQWEIGPQARHSSLNYGRSKSTSTSRLPYVVRQCRRSCPSCLSTSHAVTIVSSTASVESMGVGGVLPMPEEAGVACAGLRVWDRSCAAHWDTLPTGPPTTVTWWLSTSFPSVEPW